MRCPTKPPSKKHRASRAYAPHANQHTGRNESTEPHAIMVVGILQFEIGIEYAQSLKDKRRVVSSLKDRLHHDHMVAVAEVGSLDDPRKALMGISMVSNDVSHCQSVLDRIVDKLRLHRDCVLNDFAKEILTGR